MTAVHFPCIRCHVVAPLNAQGFDCPCGASFCSVECGARGWANAETFLLPPSDYPPPGWEPRRQTRATCCFCRHEDAADQDLLAFLLERYKLARGDAVSWMHGDLVGLKPVGAR